MVSLLERHALIKPCQATREQLLEWHAAQARSMTPVQACTGKAYSVRTTASLARGMRSPLRAAVARGSTRGVQDLAQVADVEQHLAGHHQVEALRGAGEPERGFRDAQLVSESSA